MVPVVRPLSGKTCRTSIGTGPTPNFSPRRADGGHRAANSSTTRTPHLTSTTGERSVYELAPNRQNRVKRTVLGLQDDRSDGSLPRRSRRRQKKTSLAVRCHPRTCSREPSPTSPRVGKTANPFDMLNPLRGRCGRMLPGPGKGCRPRTTRHAVRHARPDDRGSAT